MFFFPSVFCYAGVFNIVFIQSPRGKALFFYFEVLFSVATVPLSCHVYLYIPNPRHALDWTFSGSRKISFLAVALDPSLTHTLLSSPLILILTLAFALAPALTLSPPPLSPSPPPLCFTLPRRSSRLAAAGEAFQRPRARTLRKAPPRRTTAGSAAPATARGRGPARARRPPSLRRWRCCPSFSSSARGRRGRWRR